MEEDLGDSAEEEEEMGIGKEELGGIEEKELDVEEEE